MPIFGKMNRISGKHFRKWWHITFSTSVKEVQNFLGLSENFRKFIPKFSLITKPLNDLLRDGVKFQRKGLNMLKNSMSEQPALQIYDSNLETEIHTDASKQGLGVVLLQKSVENVRFHYTYYTRRKKKSYHPTN